ncbi:MAG: RRXRR domain-containing protein, partial [Moorellaceae bacterium]
MYVFVLNDNGKPLMPTHAAKARKLLKAKKARIVSRNPFTIRLNY